MDFASCEVEFSLAFSVILGIFPVFQALAEFINSKCLCNISLQFLRKKKIRELNTFPKAGLVLLVCSNQP